MKTWREKSVKIREKLEDKWRRTWKNMRNQEYKMRKRETNGQTMEKNEKIGENISREK